LPQTAITYNPYGSTVFVLAPPPASQDALKDDKGQPYLVAQQVFVTTGPTRGDQVAILTG
jgi:membrane fusion protein (multidrug efflux system)